MSEDQNNVQNSNNTKNNETENLDNPILNKNPIDLNTLMQKIDMNTLTKNMDLGSLMKMTSNLLSSNKLINSIKDTSNQTSNQDSPQSSDLELTLLSEKMEKILNTLTELKEATGNELSEIKNELKAVKKLYKSLIKNENNSKKKSK